MNKIDKPTSRNWVKERWLFDMDLGQWVCDDLYFINPEQMNKKKKIGILETLAIKIGLKKAAKWILKTDFKASAQKIAKLLHDFLHELLPSDHKHK